MNPTIACFTPNCPEPPYINASVMENGMTRVIVRSSPDENKTVTHAHIDMPEEDWLDFVRQAVTHAARENRKINDAAPGGAAA